jgi:hypothetical protein
VVFVWTTACTKIHFKSRCESLIDHGTRKCEWSRSGNMGVGSISDASGMSPTPEGPEEGHWYVSETETCLRQLKIENSQCPSDARRFFANAARSPAFSHFVHARRHRLWPPETESALGGEGVPSHSPLTPLTSLTFWTKFLSLKKHERAD